MALDPEEAGKGYLFHFSYCVFENVGLYCLKTVEQILENSVLLVTRNETDFQIFSLSHFWK